MNDAEWLEQRRSYKESKGATKRLSFVGGVHDDVVEFSSRKCQTISDSDSDAYQRHLPLIARYYIAFFFYFPAFLVVFAWSRLRFSFIIRINDI